MRYWVTADTHFYHDNIINYCGRPFINVNQMNKVLLKNWNDTVGKDDVVFFVGDFSFGDRDTINKLLRKLKGNKIFIKGNHDRVHAIPKIIQSIIIQYSNYNIKLLHNPNKVKEYDHNIDFYITAHCHQRWKTRVFKIRNYIDESRPYYVPLINCGVDVWNYKPIELKHIVRTYQEMRHEIEKKNKASANKR